MPADIIPFRLPDGLTDAECNDAMARMRPVMVALCGRQGGRAAITTRVTDEGASYVSAVVDDGAWAFCREGRRYVLVGPDWETVATGVTLEEVLAAVR